MYYRTKRNMILRSFLLFCFTKVYGSDEQLVNYYLNLINTSLNEIENYKTPIDNRMYEPDDARITGKSRMIICVKK